MGANSPRLPVSSPETKSSGFPPFIIAVIAFLIVCALEWSDVIEYIDGEPRLTTKHQNQLQKKLNELEEAEQYALVAQNDGYYPCLHSNRQVYFLRAGEVWKYGVTIKGEKSDIQLSFCKSMVFHTSDN